VLILQVHLPPLKTKSAFLQDWQPVGEVLKQPLQERSQRMQLLETSE
jgi:hypothetical protein